jgi:hypothetical protein
LNLVAEVSGVRNVAREKDSQDVAVQFDLHGADPDLNVAGSQMCVILPRVFGKRYLLGEHVRVTIEEIHTSP